MLQGVTKAVTDGWPTRWHLGHRPWRLCPVMEREHDLAVGDKYSTEAGASKRMSQWMGQPQKSRRRMHPCKDGCSATSAAHLGLGVGLEGGHNIGKMQKGGEVDLWHRRELEVGDGDTGTDLIRMRKEQVVMFKIFSI